MLLHDPSRNTGLERLTLVFPEKEAQELIEQMTYLVAHPEYHHGHLEDYDIGAILDTVVLDRIDVRTLNESSKSMSESSDERRVASHRS